MKLNVAMMAKLSGATGVAALAAGMLAAPALAQTAPAGVDQTAPAAPGAAAIPADAPPPTAAAARTDANAQTDATTATTAQAAPPEDIVVTGTRVTRDGYQAPTPTTVVTSAAFEQSAQPTVVDYVNTLPALSGSSTPRNTGTVVSGGLGGANLLNLRNLGVNRTLVLLDGRRVVSAATNGAVDVNTLPVGLLQRVDVVTGGASAAWGSDAVAGVVNFVLDTKFSGVKGEIQSGITDYGDARRFRATVSAGTSFADGRGHVIASGEYVDNESAGRAGSRDWFKSYKILNNSLYAPGNGQPRRLLSPNVGLSTASDGGLITAGPLRGTQFLPGGAPAPFAFGQVGGNLMIGGEPNNDAARMTQLLAPLTYGTAFVRASYDVTDAISVFAEGSYGISVTRYRSSPYYRLGNITIQRDNAFLDEATRTRMVNAGVTSFTMGRTNFDFGEPAALNRREMYRGVVGLNGDLGGGWSWDAYYQHGESDVLNEVSNDQVVARYNLATDAVRAPNGAIVCRSSLANPGNGCVPVNLFGAGSPSAAALNYINGIARQNITLQQDVAAATLRGEPFSLPAGPVSLASGVEYRREAFTADADAISIANGFWVGNYKPAGGSYDVKEGFVELVAPVIKSDGVIRSMDLNGAVRVTDYNTSGTVATWKIGSTISIADTIRLRGTASRDIRAPNLNDLYLGGTVLSQLVVDNDGRSYFTLRNQTGNPNLTPEKATTLSGGVVFTPQFVPGLNLSVDYYNIRIKDAIATLTLQQIVDGCGGGTTSLCQFIQRNAAGNITQIAATGLNLAQEKTSGVDIEGSFRRRLSDLGLGSGSGMLTMRGLVTYVHDRVIELPGTRIDYAGEVADFSLPKWRGLFSVNYDDDATSLTFTGRYIGPAKLNNAWVEGIDINDNSVPSVWYFDANAAVKIADADRGKYELFFSVQNLFGTGPKPSPNTTQVGTYGANATVYDTLGRQFLTGLRFSF